ncbi:MAG: membrane protein insertase YidC [Sphingobium sp.]|nr:membrane protein insertase YidC [Sphingobium sp.]
MDDKRNLILAAALTLAILFGWPLISERFFPTPKQPPVAAAPATPQAATPAGISGADAASEAAEKKEPIRPLNAVLSSAPRVAIDTPKLKGSINLKGARIDDIVLPTYRETIEKNAAPVRLFAPIGTKDAYFAGFGWRGDGLKTPDRETLWAADGKTLTPKTPVTLNWDNGVGQRFKIRFSIDENYMLTAQQSIENTGATPVSTVVFGYVSRRNQSADHNSCNNHTGPMGVFDGSANYGISFDTLDGKQPSIWATIFSFLCPTTSQTRYETTGGWVGFTDKYWHSAIIPAQDRPVSAGFNKGERYQADISYAPVMVPPGKRSSTTSQLFVGAKETKLLERYTEGGVKLLDRAIDWGWFYWFEKPIFYLLDWLFHAIGNFGVAIICLTFVVRGLMFPIAQKQFASMAAMRAIQPKMKAIQEKYKDDKPKAQQAIMELYRQEKVNPLAGCLPIFLQIPIFFALYKVLMLTIEMRHQPFVLWIKDLSAPDPLHILNLFGLLDFTPPGFLSIGVLAILLGITMYLQFKLNPAPMDDMQKQIFQIMPWMMMFIMAPFAAGLLIYWCTSNLLTIAQQWWLYRQHPALRQPAVAK